MTNNRISPLGLGARNRLYHNQGGVFVDTAAALGVDDGGTAFGSAWGDLDNDGRPDLYLVRGVLALVGERHLLYHDQGPATPWPPLPAPALPVGSGTGRSVAWADYDNDGRLDVYVTGGVQVPIPLFPVTSGTLLRNRGDGSFEDATAAAGLGSSRNGHGVAWGDFDNDRWPDLFVVNHGVPDLGTFETNALYRNRGDGTFEDVSAAMGVGGDEDGKKRGCFGAAWADYDGDGWLDLYVTCGYDTSPSSDPTFSTTNLLYRNLGGSGFEERAVATATADPAGSFGCAWGDHDNDGWIDLYVANGLALPPLAPANRLYRNAGSAGGFADVAAAAGVDSDSFSQATAWADVERDGDLDLYVVETNRDDRLYRNLGGGGHWLELRLEGRRANRSAVGARVRVTAGARTQVREVSGGSGYLSQDDLVVHVGLGGETAAAVVVAWPGPDFCVQSLGVVAADQLLPVVEDCTSAPPSVLRAPFARPLSSVFPLPPYRPLPPAPPFIDPEPVLGGPDPLLFYQVEAPATLRVIESGSSVSLHY